MSKVVEDLTHGRIREKDTCHLDPDLSEGMYPRMPGWRPIFGQRGASARHLARHGISRGDIFLFFGWFRQVEFLSGTYRYVLGAPHLHLLFGWFQVGEVLSRADAAPAWARYHPHLQDDYGPDNVVFISSEVLELGSAAVGIPGAGVFSRYDERLRLTARGRTRSWWSLPAWFYPAEGKEPLTHHRDPSRWQLQGDRVFLRTSSRGQEFVLHADQYPEVVPWICSLIQPAAQQLAAADPDSAAQSDGSLPAGARDNGAGIP